MGHSGTKQPPICLLDFSLPVRGVKFAYFFLKILVAGKLAHKNTFFSLWIDRFMRNKHILNAPDLEMKYDDRKLRKSPKFCLFSWTSWPPNNIADLIFDIYCIRQIDVVLRSNKSAPCCMEFMGIREVTWLIHGISLPRWSELQSLCCLGQCWKNRDKTNSRRIHSAIEH